MANRIACTALTGRIAMGRTNAAGTAFSGPNTDVTSDVLKAVIDKAAFHGCSFDIEGGGEKWVVTVAKASAAPMSEQPAPSDAGILHVWASFVSEPTANLPLTNADKVAFARAVLARWGAPAAVSAPSVPEDATRLDFIGMHRVALIPEFEGGWDAQVYEEDAVPSVIVVGATVRAAVDAAMAATKNTP